MYKKLDNKGLNRFAKKYLPNWANDIENVSILRYGFIKEYLVNEHYLVVDYVYKVIEKDLQDI